MPLPTQVAYRPPPALAARAAAPASASLPERISSALVATTIALAATIATPCAAVEIAPLASTSTTTTTTTTSSSTTTSKFASTPYTDLSNAIDYGLTRDGRIRPCPGAIPNCVSTSSTTDLYAPAVRAEGTTPARAAELLDAAVVAGELRGEKIFEGAVAASRGGGGDGLGGIFLQYEVPGASGRVRGPAGQPTKDVVEVLLRPERKAAAAAREKGSGVVEEEESVDTLVLFRSLADPDSIRFLPLLQQPLTDGGAQKARMRSLLVERLGWRATSCDSLDCLETK